MRSKALEALETSIAGFAVPLVIFVIALVVVLVVELVVVLVLEVVLVVVVLFVLVLLGLVYSN